MTPVSGEVTLCDLNSEEIKPGISESFDCLSKNNLTASNSQLPFSQTSKLNVSSTFQRQDTFLSGFFSPSFFLSECVRATQTSAHLCCYKACKMKCAISCCPEKKCKMWKHQKKSLLYNRASQNQSFCLTQQFTCNSGHVSFFSSYERQRNMRPSEAKPNRHIIRSWC